MSVRGHVFRVVFLALPIFFAGAGSAGAAQPCGAASL